MTQAVCVIASEKQILCDVAFRQARSTEKGSKKISGERLDGRGISPKQLESPNHKIPLRFVCMSRSSFEDLCSIVDKLVVAFKTKTNNKERKNKVYTPHDVLNLSYLLLTPKSLS
uniref:Uncharacterized protein n=1 Tax=Steinernema glaseri TaxID=37863 RepID=A0A1I7Z5V4_9BILA